MPGLFSKLLKNFIDIACNFPDARRGQNKQYSMLDIALSAFSVFFTQSPSFLCHQKSMKDEKGKSNAENLFEIEKIPSDNHIRKILDKVHPDNLKPVFQRLLSYFSQTEKFNTFLNLETESLLIALDGTWYFSSDNIHCDACLYRKSSTDDQTHFYHSAITPVIVSPNQNRALSLFPEFIVPQDGDNKQDCEMKAAFRWLKKMPNKIAEKEITILGDDLYSKHPFCRDLVKNGFHFIFVCKEKSHKNLYEWKKIYRDREENGLQTLLSRERKGNKWIKTTYKYMNQLPIRGSKDSLLVNWIEVESVIESSGKVVYKNNFITDYELHPDNVVEIVSCGRARWKIENENNNVLKNRGYNLEHNFGHGKKNLSSLLATMNILAFLFHSLLELSDKNYQELRAKLSSRKVFFDDIRALTKYFCFENWDLLLEFMIEGLKKRHRLDSG